MFGGIFGSKKPKPSGPTPLSPAITETILSAIGTRSIPSMPGAAQRAFQLSVDPNAEARDFVDVIESDEGLSARVVKIANSVYFERGHRSKTIEDAVNVIGVNELRCLLNATTLAEIFPSRHPARAALWAHDVAVGLTSRTLATRLIPAQSEVAFLAGLMHDVGKLLLLQRSAEDYGKILRTVQETGIQFSTAEEAIFPFTHTEVGQLVAERWNFGPDLVAAIADHHREPVSSSGITLTAIVCAADTIAHAHALGSSPLLQRLRPAAEERLPRTLAMCGISTSDSASIIEQCRGVVEREFDLYVGSQTR